MITEEIIKQLALELTDLTTGKSFMNNCGIYLYKQIEDAKVYIMDCDFDGLPLNDSRLIAYMKGDKVYSSVSFDRDMVFDLKMFEEYLEKALVEKYKKLFEWLSSSF